VATVRVVVVVVAAHLLRVAAAAAELGYLAKALMVRAALVVLPTLATAAPGVMPVQ
jgi:hypothetical protein